jgi:hypothetical protein
MTENNNIDKNDDEISLKEIIQNVHALYAEVVKKIYIVIGFCVIASGFFLFNHFMFQPKYVTETKFLVEGNNGGGGFGGLLGQFGLKNSGKFNPYKIIEVAKSKNILKKIFFYHTENGLIINQILKEYNLVEKWSKKDPKWENFSFKNKEIEKFTDLESKAFLNIYSLTVGSQSIKDPLLNFSYDEESGIYRYGTSTSKEKLSLLIVERAYAELKLFFEEELLTNQLNSTLILKEKSDSIQSLIYKKSYQLAGQQDQTLGLVRNQPGARKAILEKEILALTQAYSEILKNYEIADINLKDTRPMFIKLDETISPIEPIDSSLLIAIIKGVFLGGIVGVFFIIIRKKYMEALQ